MLCCVVLWPPYRIWFIENHAHIPLNKKVAVCRIALHGPLSPLVRSWIVGVALYCSVVYRTVLQCTVLCCAVSCCVVLYCAVLYCTRERVCVCSMPKESGCVAQRLHVRCHKFADSVHCIALYCFPRVSKIPPGVHSNPREFTATPGIDSNAPRIHFNPPKTNSNPPETHSNPRGIHNNPPETNSNPLEIQGNSQQPYRNAQQPRGNANALPMHQRTCTYLQGASHGRF